jgi:protein-tyrosine phosphatase
VIDLHTHLLWDWDDGPDDRAQAREMCRVAEKDGVTAIALTPHVFRLSRYGDNLDILRQRMGEFDKALGNVPIEFHWGAEVFVHPELVASIEKFGFTLDDTNYVFIEFPADSVPPGTANLVYNLMAKGYVPIISHPERNRGFIERPELLFELVSTGCIAQVTAMSLTGEFGKETRSAAGLFLEHNLVHIIASDAHSAVLRPPVLSGAVEAARKIVGEAKAMAMVTEIPRAILENRALPDWGEPENPMRRKTWTQRLLMPKKSFLVKIK